MSPSMSLHCKKPFSFSFGLTYLIILNIILIKCSFCFILVCCFILLLCSNLSGLNLDGEISPAIGNLKGLQSMYSSSLPYNYFICFFIFGWLLCRDWFSLCLLWSVIWGEIVYQARSQMRLVTVRLWETCNFCNFIKVALKFSNFCWI